MPNESCSPGPCGPGGPTAPGEARVVVLLPVYQPGRALLELIDDLRLTAPDVDVVVIDDGSDEPSADRVLHAARDRGCTLLRLRRNRGKGMALRVGFRYAAAHHPGQHVGLR
ncbi:glycosyltransferase [Micromonospora inyonensis]|uniref:glycosyltransferase n=1 Tax=Micromonospora inyonensis TaxID=47866 RepID=UPI000B813834|nr:glycosyltransferase [Micromonospora inyonensis]